MNSAQRLDDGGFTLIEVLVVCGIAALMLVLAVPTVAGTLESLRVNNATAALAANIRLAQSYAQKERLRARVVFGQDFNSYTVELATSTTAAEDCGSTQYEVLKTEEIDPSVFLRDATFSCIVFEPTGRTAWSNPRVLSGATTPPDPNSKPIWIIFTNGVEAPWTSAVGTDPDANTWTDPATGTVEVLVDLGRVRFVDTVCPQVIRDAGDGVDFPESILVEWSTDTGASPPPPGLGHWRTVGTRAKPYTEAIQSDDGTDWWRACPRFTVNQNTRYIRFTFVPSQFDVGYARVMALDEIKLSDPGVVVSSVKGTKSRKLTIAPITGRVTIH